MRGQQSRSRKRWQGHSEQPHRVCCKLKQCCIPSLQGALGQEHPLMLLLLSSSSSMGAKYPPKKVF